MEGGEQLTQEQRDVEYASRYWKRLEGNHEQDFIENMRSQMETNIQTRVDSGDGVFGIFIGLRDEGGKKIIDEESREKMSAYRELARNMGIQIGQYRLQHGLGLLSPR